MFVCSHLGPSSSVPPPATSLLARLQMLEQDCHYSIADFFRHAPISWLPAWLAFAILSYLSSGDGSSCQPPTQPACQSANPTQPNAEIQRYRDKKLEICCQAPSPPTAETHRCAPAAVHAIKACALARIRDLRTGRRWPVNRPATKTSTSTSHRVHRCT